MIPGVKSCPSPVEIEQKETGGDFDVVVVYRCVEKSGSRFVCLL